MPKKRWDELSGAQKEAIVLTGAVSSGCWRRRSWTSTGGRPGDPGRKATVDRGGVHQLRRPDLLLPVRAEAVETPHPADV